MVVGDCGDGERVVLCWVGQGLVLGVETIAVCVLGKMMVLLTRVGGNLGGTAVFRS